MNDSNGTAGLGLPHIIEQIEAELRFEQETLDTLEQAVKDQQLIVKRLSKAVDVLTVPYTPQQHRREKRQWTPREETLKRTLEFLKAADAPVSVAELSERSGITRDALRRSLGVLRRTTSRASPASASSAVVARLCGLRCREAQMLERLRIVDLSDREFLLVMHDLADEEGWTDSLAVAQQLLGKDANRRLAAGRLSWLQRWGVVERQYERDEAGNIRYSAQGLPRWAQRWRLTKEGEAFALGKLTAATERTVGSLRDETLVALTAALTERARRTGFVGRKLMEREWRFGTARERNGR